METYEIRALIKRQHMRSRESWEQARMISFICAKTGGAKIERIEDLVKFPWEMRSESEETAEQREAHLSELREKAKCVAEMLNGEG